MELMYIYLEREVYLNNYRLTIIPVCVNTSPAETVSLFTSVSPLS